MASAVLALALTVPGPTPGATRRPSAAHRVFPPGTPLADRGETEDYWLGGYAINLIVSETIALIATLIYIVNTRPEMPHAQWIGVTLAALTPILFYAFARAVWLAWDLSFRPHEPGD